jgi:5-methylcytosine-specific restriction endonuclease McrA
MSKVFLVDNERKPLDPIHPGWARKLLSSGQAAVLRRYPFTLILKKSVKPPQVKALRIKLDPGSKTTGIAITNDASGEVIFAAELSHQGQKIKKALDGRRGVRKSRRARHTRYRKPRWRNRRRHAGWLPPSLESRIANITTWVSRLLWWCPIGEISMELVRFDMQAIENPEIAGTEYQQGILAGYELREYLLFKWGHACAYCSKQNVPLQVEHIVPKAKGGTNRVSNLCIACEPCNQRKGIQALEQFLKRKPGLLKSLQAQAKAPLKDASAVNATRWALFERLRAFGLPVECGSGGLTKFNRVTKGLPKIHWVDAVCVGKSTPETIQLGSITPLLIEAKGHGNRQMGYADEHGFIIRHRKRQRKHFGYQTGDLVRAVVPASLKTADTHVGRVLSRATGSFDLTTRSRRVAGVSYHYCQPIHQSDGYNYTKGAPYARAVTADPTTRPA